MELHGIKIENVIRHYDVTHKICPEPFTRDEQAWENFKRRANMQKFTNVKEALDYLVNEDRITDRNYWEKAITTTRNVEFLIIKWANDANKI